MKYMIIIVALLIITTGCATDSESEGVVHYTSNPTAEEVLADNEHTDIFVMNDIVYVNAEGINWVKQSDITLGEEVLVITNQSNKGEDLVDGTATTLPIGTKIYESLEKGDILIAIVDDTEIRYLGWREG